MIFISILVVSILWLSPKIITATLTKPQWNQIKTLLCHPSTTPIMQRKIRNVLYQNYENWAIHQAYEFKKYHTYKCRTITIDELKTYAQHGLIQAIQNYNPQNYTYSPFTEYVKPYIKGELYKGMTNLQPLTILPKKYRISSKWALQNRKKYRKTLNPIFIGLDHWMIEKRQDTQISPTIHFYEQRDKYIYIWATIYKVLINDPFSKRVIEHKYNFEFQKRNSNKYIAELMGCSEETIRKKINYTLQQIKPESYYPRIRENMLLIV